MNDKLDKNYFQRDCPGHNVPLNENCINCQKDYDLKHYPNNTDCPLYKSYFNIERIITEELSRRQKILDQEIIGHIITNLFLREVINPSTKNYEEIIRENINEGLRDVEKRKDFFKELNEINDGNKNISIGII